MNNIPQCKSQNYNRGEYLPDAGADKDVCLRTWKEQTVKFVNMVHWISSNFLKFGFSKIPLRK